MILERIFDLDRSIRNDTKNCQQYKESKYYVQPNLLLPRFIDLIFRDITAQIVRENCTLFHLFF